MEQKIINAVNAIIDDISDRRGLGNEWEAIDEDIQQEIRNEWAVIIRESVL